MPISFAMRPGSAGTLLRAALPMLALILAFLPNLANAADPIQVPRYDDADEYLPTAQKKNKDNIRLLLQQQPGEVLFKVLTPRNVTVDVVANVPPDADTAVILLVGGTSVLSIVNDRLDRSFSFQPRSRDYWWANKFATFLIDAPSDRLGKDGIQDQKWRAGAEHKLDLKAVLDAIAQRFPGPFVIQGHSNGAISLASVASLNHPRVKAYAYSGAAHYRSDTSILREVEHTAPVLVMEHRKDSCAVSPAWQAEAFAKSVKASVKQLLWIEGGSDPLSGACGPFAAHSFFGVEKLAVDTLAIELRKVMR
jgi:hypothetical protein